jgi:hypothetical protein
MIAILRQLSYHIRCLTEPNCLIEPIGAIYDW